jgi:RNA polymerase sigma factor (sigma-70 family)
MQETSDTDLLRQYDRENSEEAFSTLVTRYVNMVYSAALRKTGDPSAAEEITQAVFVILAKKADTLSRHTALSGWLYQATRLTAANFLRTEIRRARREQEAFMQSLSNQTEPEVWPQIMPLLEDAMGQLGEKDRNALALRFFQDKSFQEIGMAFGATENAAKKRVAYALEKLRIYFSKRGVTSTATTLAGVIAANSVQAAPATLAKTATSMALAKGATASTSTLTLIQGALKVMAWTKAKTAACVGIGILVAAGTALIAVKIMSAHSVAAAVAQSDANALQGTWTGAESRGPAGATLTIAGTTLEFHSANPAEWYKATFTLREDTSPKQLIAVITDCPAPPYVGKTSYAIYQIQDGTITFSGNEPGKPTAPKGFDAPGARKFVFTKK